MGSIMVGYIPATCQIFRNVGQASPAHSSGSLNLNQRYRAGLTPSASGHNIMTFGRSDMLVPSTSDSEKPVHHVVGCIRSRTDVIISHDNGDLDVELTVVRSR